MTLSCCRVDAVVWLRDGGPAPATPGHLDDGDGHGTPHQDVSDRYQFRADSAGLAAQSAHNRPAPEVVLVDGAAPLAEHPNRPRCHDAPQEWMSKPCSYAQSGCVSVITVWHGRHNGTAFAGSVIDPPRDRVSGS